MFKITRPWNWFLCLGKPSAATLAQRELEDAQRALLEAQSGREYAHAMCQYHEARVQRLRVYLQEVAHASA